MADVRQRLAVGANVLDDEGLDPRTNGRITSLRRARVTSVWPFMIVLLIVLFLYWERHKLGTRWKQLQDEGKSNEKTQGSLEKEASQLHKNGDRRKRVRPDPPISDKSSAAQGPSDAPQVQHEDKSGSAPRGHSADAGEGSPSADTGPVDTDFHWRYKGPRNIPRPKTSVVVNALENGDGKKYAFVSVISNEKYVDGAIVLALSLYNTSYLLQEKYCELVLLAPSDLHKDSQRRLRHAGYHHIKSMPSLAHYLPGSMWKDTFDKLYLWSLYDYSVIAYYDADMLALEDPDSVFNFPLPNATFIGALGSGNKKYFQTGMMTIIPNKETFEGLLEHFKEGVRTKLFYGYNARDGEVARSYFGPRFVRLSNYYSTYRNASESLAKIKVFHFRGFFKPWYDMKHPPHFKPSQATGAVEFGQAYRMWWEYYEQFHVAHFQAGEEPLEGWGGKAAGQAHPSTHVWVMRHSKDQYVQRLWSEILKERDVVYEGWQLRLGHPGQSCDDVCGKASLRCDAKGHTFTPVNTCEAIATVLRVTCKACVVDRSDALTPYYSVPKQRCFINFLHDKALMPTCSAKDKAVKRMCVCVPREGTLPTVPFTSFEQISGAAAK